MTNDWMSKYRVSDDRPDRCVDKRPLFINLACCQRLVYFQPISTLAFTIAEVPFRVTRRVFLKKGTLIFYSGTSSSSCLYCYPGRGDGPLFAKAAAHSDPHLHIYKNRKKGFAHFLKNGSSSHDLSNLIILGVSIVFKLPSYPTFFPIITNY